MTDDIVPILRSEFNNCRSNAYYSGECCCDAKWAEDYVTLAADEIEQLRIQNVELMRLYYKQYDSEEIKELQKENAQLKHRIMRLEGMP